MSVTRQPERFTVALSSEQFASLTKAIHAGKTFEVYGKNCVIEIEQDRLYWMPKEEAKA